jgi:hypothetical protein
MQYRVEVEATGGFVTTFEAENDSDAAAKIQAEIQKRYGQGWGYIRTEIKKAGKNVDPDCVP